MGENIIVPLAVLCGVVILYYSRTKWGPKSHEKNKHRTWYRKMFNVDKLDKKYQSEFNSNDTLQLVAFSILLVFLGLRTGMGVAVKSKLKNHGLKLKNIIQFEDGEKQK